MTVPSFLGMLLLQIILIAVNAFFAATEIALLQLSVTKLRKQAEDGSRPAARVLRLAEEPSNFLSTIQIGITLGGYLGSAFAASNFAAPLTNWLINDLGWTLLPQGTTNTLVILLITFILAYFNLVFGELVPKQIAIHKPFEVARIASMVIVMVAAVARPAVALLSASTKLILHLLGFPAGRSEEVVTEDEIRMMVDVGHESGSIDSEEKEMIENVFELDKTLARDVMTHRVDVVLLEADANAEDIVRTIVESGLSRIPVYDDDPDDILGVLSTRTYLLNLREKHPKPLRSLLRPAHFVPETVPADVLLRDMQLRKEHLAIVLNEYAGFSGIVSMEDIIEEIVGNIYDEFDPLPPTEIKQEGENLWRIAGETPIDKIEEELSITLPADREYDTLGGLVFSCLTSIPDDGTVITADTCGLHIETAPVSGHYIEWALVSLLPAPEDAPDDKAATNNPKRK